MPPFYSIDLSYAGARVECEFKRESIDVLKLILLDTGMANYLFLSKS